MNSAHAAGGLRYDEALIPQFNVPHMSKPPVIDGKIDPAEWESAAKVMGMVESGVLEFKDRPVSFRLGWDEQNLYLAFKVDILTEPKPHLVRAHRDKYTTQVVFDDALEVGLFMHDRNRVDGEETSFLKFILNSLGSGEYMKNYPSIGQVMFNWAPDFKVKNRVYTDENGRQWWEMEVAMDLEDLQMKKPHQEGDRIDIGLFADVKNPTWQWLDFPSASGHLEHYGFPRVVLTKNEPYIQVEEISGLHDQKVSFRSVVRNPSTKAVKVDASLAVEHGTTIKDGAYSGAIKEPTEVLRESRTLEIPPGGSAPFDVSGAFKDWPPAQGRAQSMGFLQLALKRADAPDVAPIFTFACNVWGTDKKYLTPAKIEPRLVTRIAYNPANGRLALSADTMDAPVPEGSKVVGATYRVLRGETLVAEGKLANHVNQWFEDLIELGKLSPGKYQVKMALVDSDGKELIASSDEFEKVNEAEMFAAWWENKIGNTERLLKPFEPLKVDSSSPNGATRISVTRRVYDIDSLGLPLQIEANGGPLLSAPARIVLKVGGKEYTVPTDGKIKITSKKDWRVDFESAPVTVAGVTFSATGWMEQDGLVELALTYQPAGTDKSEKNKMQTTVSPVEIEELRIEWPLDDSLGLHMASMGQGGNYSARTIGEVPAGAGQVWNTRDNLGKAGSGRRAGNFVGNVWVGTEQRGLLWAADSDRGWVPGETVPAHALVRTEGAGEKAGEKKGQIPTVAIVNNLIGLEKGQKPFVLTEPRTVRFGYNASPFRHLADGWRLNQKSAAGSFSGGKYKVNWDTGAEFFTVLSPPFEDKARWPEYYAHCKESAHKLTYEGYSWQLQPSAGASSYYSSSNRRVFYNANQIALRGYGYKSLENPNPYSIFMGDWMDPKNNETLSKTYTDYMISLMDRQVKEGGCTHFYFDISFAENLHTLPAAGFGYRLPDGSLQPESSDSNLREWYKRVFSMIQENNLYPGGVSGHATHLFPMKSLAFMDAILDSEYPMTDGIDVYPSDAMIALSCPHSFGVNVQHLGNFMNPTWPAMHDAASNAASGEGGNGILGTPEFKRWGISRPDVQFVPYWRNAEVVSGLKPGLIASIWRRPGSALIAVMNYGPDAKGTEQRRTAELNLDLAALGVPAEVIKSGGERLRVRELLNYPIEATYLRHLPWARDFLQAEFPGQNIEHQRKAMPPINPQLDAATGRVSGFDVDYHDVKFIAIDWEDRAIADDGWKDMVSKAVTRESLLNWGVNSAVRLDASDLAKSASADNPQVEVQVWKRTGKEDGRGNSVLLRLTNKGESPLGGVIKLDLKALGIQVKQTWNYFTAANALDGEAVGHAESAEQPRTASVVFNAYDGEVYYQLNPGQTRVFSLDLY